ncbi:MAG: GNAT family N-acetyltransferase [Neisseria sp.]|nr:GNAT family N-acetyltransferase [Neisseria sp.]
MSGPLLLRIGNEDDVDDLSELLNASYRKTADGTQCSGYSVAYIADLLQDSRRYCFVFDNTGQISASAALLGCIIVLLDAKDDKFLKVEMTAVHPEAQQQGIGGSMLRAVEEFAALHLHQGAIEMDVDAAQDKLIAYYQKRGYTLTGKRGFSDGLETVELQKIIETARKPRTDDDDD